MREEMKRRHKQERDKLAADLEQKAQQEEKALKQKIEAEIERMLREKKNRHAAEEAAHTDLSPDQLANVNNRALSIFIT